MAIAIERRYGYGMKTLKIELPTLSPADAELLGLTASDAARLIRAKDIPHPQYIDAIIRRVAATRPFGGLISSQIDEVRRATAALASESELSPKGELAGIPIVIKDNIDVAGTVTTAGSPALEHAVAHHDAPLVKRLRDEGAFILGKANMHEFALGITNINAAYGPARNPADPERIAGGSSGGTATVISTLAAPAGVGTDTGGSIRIPAALCGIVGFRPSIGRWPSGGIVPISPTLDTAGPMARSVADCALLDSIVCNEPHHLEKVSLSGLRIGVPRPHFWADLASEMRSAADAVLTLLRSQGVVLVECEVAEISELSQGSPTVALFELISSVQNYFVDHDLRFESTSFLKAVRSPDVRAIFESLFNEHPMARGPYEHAISVLRPQLQRAYRDCFVKQKLDAIVFPTTPLAATRIKDGENILLNGKIVPAFATFIRNTSPSAFAGIPGISLPMRRTKSGLPQGIEFDAPYGTDRRLLAIASSIEALLGIPEQVEGQS